jgi:hypothetical protein
MNRDSDGDSDPSTKTINSPGTNPSRLRVATNIALNASLTRNLLIVTSYSFPIHFQLVSCPEPVAYWL